MNQQVRAKIEHCFRRFLATCGREPVVLAEDTNLVRDLGLTSEEGLELVLDLCEEFEYDFPHDFNPVVHDSGRRGRTLGELIEAVGNLLEERRNDDGSP